MPDFISELANKAGIDNGLAQKGMGALLSALQKNVPADTFSKISSAIPGAGGLLSAFQTAGGSTQQSSTPGLGGLATILIGGQSEAVTHLLSGFSKAGFTQDTVKAFIPAALNFLKSSVPPETMKQIENSLPGLNNLFGSANVGGFLGKLKNKL